MRIRSIKPEFWRSRDITSLPWDARLVFIGLWSYVDDNGVGWDDLPSIAADLFAYDLSVDTQETLRRVSNAVAALEARGLIVRYRADEKDLLMITGWKKHQIVQRPSLGHKYPEYQRKVHPEAAPLLPLYGDSPETLRTGTGEQGNRGTGEHGIYLAHPQAGEHVRATRFEEFWAIYPRKVGKQKAKAKYAAAAKRVGEQVIIDGAIRLAKDPNLPEPQFIPHPTTWLEGGRWDDDPLPPRRGADRRMDRWADEMALAAAYDQQATEYLEIEQ